MYYYGRSNNQFIDARASINKKFFCFLLSIPEDFIETKSIVYAENKIKINYLVGEKEVISTFNFRIW